MKKFLLKTIYSLILLSTTISCTLIKINKASAPPEDYWIKPGYSKNMTRTFLYENCNYLRRPSIKEFSNKSEFEKSYEIRLIKIENCMLDNGFNFSLEGPATPGTSIWSDRCNNLLFSRLPSCLSLKDNKKNLSYTLDKPSNLNSNSLPYTDMDNDYDHSIELRNKTQEKSNHQMNDLIRSINPHH